MAAKPLSQRFRGQLLVAGIALIFIGLNPARASESKDSIVRAVVERYCTDCHGKDVQKGNLDLERVSSADVTERCSAN
jgi:hypothetical protein